MGRCTPWWDALSLNLQRPARPKQNVCRRRPQIPRDAGRPGAAGPRPLVTRRGMAGCLQDLLQLAKTGAEELCEVSDISDIWWLIFLRCVLLSSIGAVPYDAVGR